MAQSAGQPHVPGTDRTPGYNLSSSSRISNEDASLELSNCLNILGYGQELRQTRRECFRQVGRNLTAMLGFVSGFVSDFEFIIVGSRAEGLSRFFESDMDILGVFKIFECLEAGFDVNLIPRNRYVLIMDTQICYPGHCILLPEGRWFPSFFQFALCKNEHGNIVLSSDSILNWMNTMLSFVAGPLVHERAGPSLPYTFLGNDVDAVFALPCHCPRILQSWAARSRHWPPPDIVAKVVSMGAFLTPVGFKGSENRHIEWRICFNTGETELMINLNDTQSQVYLVLKMIAKDVLKPQHKEITSYTLKNIVLWLAENNPQSMFHERSLFFWLRQSLLELRTALSTKTLPYFMIPNRNLMAASGLTDAQGRTWIATLTDMIDDSSKIIQRLPKKRQAIIAHPEPLLWYNARRIELEMIYLEISKRASGDVLDHILLNELRRRMWEIVYEVFVYSKENMGTNCLFECLHIFYGLFM